METNAFTLTSPSFLPAPSSPPLGVQLEQTESPGELRVRWLPPPADTHNGLIIGYRLKAVPQLTGIKETEETSDKTIKTASLYAKQETIVTGLLKGVRYAVSVAAFNSAGSGPFSIPLFQDTREGAPEEGPSSVECGGVTSTALRVSWQPIPPHKQAGALIGYTVLYAAQGRQWMNSTSLVTELRLQGLYKFTNYTVKVAGFSNYGLGPFSFPIICSTLQDEAYEKSQTLELKGLTEGRQYDVWVTASTAVGEGPESRRVTNTPSQRAACTFCGSPKLCRRNYFFLTLFFLLGIDQSLSGNYTCLAKNLYGSDSVVFTVKVLPLPDPPTLRATPYKDYIVVEWDEIRSYGNDSIGFGISYNLTWKENDGLWQEAWPVSRENRLPGVQSHTLAGLKCGTKYSIRVTATDSVGTSAPAHIDVTTLGGAPVSPPSTDWLWSNATHIYIQLSGWDDSGCDVTRWEVDYRLLGSNIWQRAENKAVSMSIFNYYNINNLIL
ncbi:hypothetical protein HF086_001916 [Spodoptera exigua]|uniref:Fibronectin type-III domain-containing protein n=1 Tax=Spodoptera exigua TaxID=7107 RepID=A0A922MDV6_SPOEX|nr:hypothetical protein HF086_001916 [Spodoptera exigua]